MNRQKIILFTTVVALIGATALGCVYLKNNRKLGNPGLKMLQERVVDVKGNTVGEQTIALPLKVLDYTASTNHAVTMEELGWLPKDTTYARRAYKSDDQFGILVNVVMMGTDSRSIHKPQICLPGQGWTIDSQEMLTIPIEKPHRYDLPVMKILSSKQVDVGNGQRQTYRSIYVYWFVAEDQITADHFDRMWRMGVSLLRTGTLQRWSYVSCFSACLPGQEQATYERISKFITASVPEFQLATGQPKPSEAASLVTQQEPP